VQSDSPDPPDILSGDPDEAGSETDSDSSLDLMSTISSGVATAPSSDAPVPNHIGTGTDDDGAAYPGDLVPLELGAHENTVVPTDGDPSSDDAGDEPPDEDSLADSDHAQEEMATESRRCLIA